MTTLKATEDILSMSEFRTTLADCVARTRETQRPLILTQNGRASSVFLDVAAWEALQEKLDRLETYEDILAAEGEADREETNTLEDFRKTVVANREKRPKKSARVAG